MSDFSLFFIQFLLPPGLNILIFVIALAVYAYVRWLAILLAVLSVFILSAFSSPRVANGLFSSLAIYPSFEFQKHNIGESATAIIILGHGDSRTAPELGYIDTVGPITLERLRYGAFLHKKLELPVLISGGRKAGQASPESVLANQVMIDEFDAAPKWLETKSANIQQQAKRTAELLQQNDIKKAYLITHALYMELAISEFNRYSLELIPAPINRDLARQQQGVIHQWMPSAAALHTSQQALFQYISRVLYW